jgi:hypothetical protein
VNGRVFMKDPVLKAKQVVQASQGARDSKDNGGVELAGGDRFEWDHYG